MVTMNESITADRFSWTPSSRNANISNISKISSSISSISINNSSSSLLTFWEKLLSPSDEQVEMADQGLSALGWVLRPLAVVLTMLTVVVFLHPALRSSASFYIVVLSLVQVLNLLVDLLDSLIQEIHPGYDEDRGYWVYTLYFAVLFSALSRRGSYLVMCLLSLERLYAILRPLHLKTFLLSRRPGLVTLAAYVVAGLLHAYIPAKTYVAAMTVAGGGARVVYRPQPTSLYVRHKEINDAFSLLAKVLLMYLPLLSLLLLSALTVSSLRRYRQSTVHLSSASKEEGKFRREYQLTFTILLTTIAYVSLSLPQAFHFFLSTIYPRYSYMGQFRNMYVINKRVTTTLVDLSCTVDFFCFLSTNSRFRKVLCRLVCCLWRQDQSDSSGKDGNPSVST